MLIGYINVYENMSAGTRWHSRPFPAPTSILDGLTPVSGVRRLYVIRVRLKALAS